MPRPAHPGRDTFDMSGALAAARRPVEAVLPDVVDILGSEPTGQTENASTGEVNSTFPVSVANVAALIEPEGQGRPLRVMVGADPATIERWIVSVPHGTAVDVDQYVDVTSSENPKLVGARLRINALLDSSTEPLRRVQASFVNRGG